MVHVFVVGLNHLGSADGLERRCHLLALAVLCCIRFYLFSVSSFDAQKLLVEVDNSGHFDQSPFLLFASILTHAFLFFITPTGGGGGYGNDGYGDRGKFPTTIVCFRNVVNCPLMLFTHIHLLLLTQQADMAATREGQ